MNQNYLPFNIIRLPKQRKLLGYLLSAFSLIWLAGCAAGIAFAFNENISLWVGFSAFGLLIYAAAFAPKISEYGMKLRQPDTLSLLAKDQRAPVLFLRSFSDESIIDLTTRTGLGGMRRCEEVICSVLRQVGPVIAIGRPGEFLPEIGAARLYVDSHDWQQAVLYFLKKAAAVVVEVGRSPGVWWEIETALEMVDRQRLLFFFPYIDEGKELRSFWPKIMLRSQFLSKSVFETMKSARDERYQLFKEHIGQTCATDTLPESLDDAHFLDFLGAKSPRILETVRPLLLDTISQLSFTNLKVGIHFEKTLRPYVDKLVRSRSMNSN